MLRAAYAPMSSLQSESFTPSIAESLVGVGAELYIKGCDHDAMRMLDVAFSVVKVPSDNLYKSATELLQLGCELLLLEDIRSRKGRDETHSVDLYQEDECDVGPRVMQAPVRPPAVNARDSTPLEAIILFNKALVCHSMCRHREAKQLYQTVLEIVQTLLASLVGVMPSNLLMELGMRTQNNMGFICYCEGEEDLAIERFEASLVFARHLCEHTNDYRVDCADALSNLCRVNWMRGDVGDTLYNHLRELLCFRSCFLPWDHPDVAASHYNLAVAEYVRQQSVNAIPHLKHYMDACSSRAESGKADLDPIPALTYLVLIANEDNEDSLSQELVRGLRTLQDKRQDQGPKTADVASVLNYVGTMLFHQEDFKNALLFFQEELRLEDSLAEMNDDVSTSVTCNNIGRILQELEKYHEAISFYQRALRAEYGDVSQLSRSKGSKPCTLTLKGKIDPSSSSANLYSTVWYNLGLIHDKLGSFDEAIFAFEMSLDLRRSMLGPDHPDIACLLYNIGVLRMERQQLEEASVCFREALRVRRIGAVGQLNDRHVVKTLEKLSSLHKAKGNIKGALEASREVFSIQEVSVDYSGLPQLKDMGITLRSIAELYHAVGDLDTSMKTAKESVQKLRAVVEEGLAGVTSWEVLVSDVEQFASSMLLLGSLYHEMCEPVLASRVLAEAAMIIEKADTHPSCSPLCGLREVAHMLATGLCAPLA